MEKPITLVVLSADANSTPQNHSPSLPFLMTSSTSFSSASILALMFHCSLEGLPRDEMKISSGSRMFEIRRMSITKCAVRCVKKVWKVTISPFSSTLEVTVRPFDTRRLSNGKINVNWNERARSHQSNSQRQSILQNTNKHRASRTFHESCSRSDTVCHSHHLAQLKQFWSVSTRKLYPNFSITSANKHGQ